MTRLMRKSKSILSKEQRETSILIPERGAPPADIGSWGGVVKPRWNLRGAEDGSGEAKGHELSGTSTEIKKEPTILAPIESEKLLNMKTSSLRRNSRCSVLLWSSRLVATYVLQNEGLSPSSWHPASRRSKLLNGAEFEDFTFVHIYRSVHGGCSKIAITIWTWRRIGVRKVKVIYSLNKCLWYLGNICRGTHFFDI